jgi:hypothetical protein
MDRRCSKCHGVSSIYERYSVLFVPFVYRYRCRDCGTKMDLYSTIGDWAMALVAIGLPTLVALLPAGKFESQSDRWWALVFLAVQGIIILAVVVRGRGRSRANPPLDT